MISLEFRTGGTKVWSARPPETRTGQGRGAAQLNKQIEHDYEQVPLFVLPDPDRTDLPIAAEYARYVGKYIDRPTTELLDELSDVHGLMWLTIARVAQVSVPALRKWRHGGNATPSNKAALARLLAACEALGEVGVSDVAAWLNTPIRYDQERLRVELLELTEGGSTLLELAEDRISQAQALDVLDATWRERHSMPTTEVTLDEHGFGTVHVADS